SGGGTLCVSSAALSCYGETGYSYQLQSGLIMPVNVGASKNGAGAILDFPVTASGLYTVKITDELTGCTAVSNAQEATILNPGVPALSQNGPTCGTAITFTATGGSGAYDWTGDVSGDGATKTTGDAAGAYTAAVRSRQTAGEVTCYSSYTGNVTGTIVSVPGTPGLSVSGAVCAGSNLTFTASGGNNNYDWTGAVSGQGNPKYAGTGAGNYTAAVRSYNTASGITCYSGYSGNVTGTIIAPGGNGQAVTCGCAAGLSNCSGTCRLCCDGNCASWTNCNFSGISNVMTEDRLTWGEAVTVCQNKGPGWRLPTITEAVCMCENRNSLPGGYVSNRCYWTSTVISPPTPGYPGTYYKESFTASPCVASEVAPSNCGGGENGPMQVHYIKCVK
ncbi:MAG: hypothetical protein LBD91_03660, partial [Prevotellaceae bacterium]|nr:hypothetical protein [Prevotellaceae bacterium]